MPHLLARILNEFFYYLRLGFRSRAHCKLRMITAPNAFKVNRDAIKFLSRMLIGKPLLFRIDALGTVIEFNALLQEQCKFVEAKIFAHKEFKKMIEGLARQYKNEAENGGDETDWNTHFIMLYFLPTVARRVRNCKRYLARLKAMLVKTQTYLGNRMLAVMLACHQRVGQSSVMNMLDDELMAKIAVLSVS